jgi:hypothetical protein
MVLVFWAVTPLQSGIFNVAPITISRNVSVTSPARLLPLPSQAAILGSNVPNAAYGVTWLGQKLPPFTRREFALAPFSWHGWERQGSNASVTANTVLYRGDLDCFVPASVAVPQGAGQGGLEVDDGKGCKEKTDITRTFGNMGSNGYQSMACNKYLIAWQKEDPPRGNVSNLVTRFCQTSYYSQPVRANISIPDGTVLQTWPLGPETALLEEEFNATRLEYIVTKGRPLGSTKQATSLYDSEPRPFDISEDSPLAQQFRELQRGFPPLNSILAGIAVGGQNLTFDQFVNNVEAIEEASRTAQRLFVALAIRTVVDTHNASIGSQPAVYTFSLQSVQLVPGITRSVQALLAVVVLLITYLAGFYHNKFLPFGSDPSSIAFLAALASRHSFRERFKGLDREPDLVSHLRYQQATLRGHHGPLSLAMDGRDEEHSIPEESDTGGLIENVSHTRKQRATQNMWPTELRLPVGLSFALGLCIAVATLVFLDKWTRTHNGLPIPSKNIVAQQVILNYIPTVQFSFSTLARW